MTAADRRTRVPPRKRFGQHFLEPAWVAKLIEVLSPAPTDLFLEIGPGRGALTIPLAARAGRLIGIEVDRDLARSLADLLPANARVVAGDFLETHLGDLLRGEPTPARVVGNLPYNVASPMLFKLMAEASEGRVVTDATLMVQREVAARLVARPGSSDYGALTIAASLSADVDRLLSLPPGAFRPVPKVSSAVVRFRFRKPIVEIASRAAFFRVVRELFSHRRKTVLNAFTALADEKGRSAAEVLAELGVDPRLRPSDLTVADYARLSRAVL